MRHDDSSNYYKLKQCTGLMSITRVLLLPPTSCSVPCLLHFMCYSRLPRLLSSPLFALSRNHKKTPVPQTEDVVTR